MSLIYVFFILFLRFGGIAYYSIVRKENIRLKEYDEISQNILNILAFSASFVYMFLGGYGGVIAFQIA